MKARTGTFTCSKPRCQVKRLASSAFCRRHHNEYHRAYRQSKAGKAYYAKYSRRKSVVERNRMWCHENRIHLNAWRREYYRKRRQGKPK